MLTTAPTNRRASTDTMTVVHTYRCPATARKACSAWTPASSCWLLAEGGLAIVSLLVVRLLRREDDDEDDEYDDFYDDDERRKVSLTDSTGRPPFSLNAPVRCLNVAPTQVLPAVPVALLQVEPLRCASEVLPVVLPKPAALRVAARARNPRPKWHLNLKRQARRRWSPTRNGKESPQGQDQR